MMQVFIFSQTHLENYRDSGGLDVSEYPGIRRSETSGSGFDRDPISSSCCNKCHTLYYSLVYKTNAKQIKIITQGLKSKPNPPGVQRRARLAFCDVIFAGFPRKNVLIGVSNQQATCYKADDPIVRCENESYVSGGLASGGAPAWAVIVLFWCRPAYVSHSMSKAWGGLSCGMTLEYPILS